MTPEQDRVVMGAGADATDAAAPEDGEAPADAAGPRPRRRRWPAIAVLLAIALVAAVVFRPQPTPLHEAAPVGWGHADGRDAARTGRVDHPALDEPTSATWTAGGDGGQSFARPTVVGDVVAIEQNGQFEVFDLADGTPLWSAPGYGFFMQELEGNLLTRSNPFTHTLHDRRSGDIVWSNGAAGALHVVDGLVFELDEGPTGGVRRFDAEDGQRLWEQELPAMPWSLVDATGDFVLLAGSHNGGEWAWASIDVATGTEVVFLHEQLPQLALVDNSRVVALGGRHGLLLIDGTARPIDLVTAELGEPIAALAAEGIDRVGEVLVLTTAGGVRAVDRSTFETLWERPGVLGVGIHAVQGLVALYSDEDLEVVRGLDGVVVSLPTNDDLRGFEAVFDGGVVLASENGIVTVLDVEGTVLWQRDLLPDRRPTLRSVTQRTLLQTLDGIWSVTDDEGNVVSPPLFSEDGADEETVTATVSDGRILAVRNGLSAYDVEPDRIAFQWRVAAEHVDALLGTDEAFVVAYDDRLAVLDRADGTTLTQVAIGDVRGLSLARDEALVVRRTSSPNVQYLDPETLEVVWSADVADLCADVTLADRVVAVPTTHGVVFLSVDDGTEVGRWEVEDSRCTDLAHHDGRFLVSSDTGLWVGTPDEAPASPVIEGKLTTAPLVLGGGQVLVGLLDGTIVALDLVSGQTEWTFELPGVRAIALHVQDGSLYAALAHGALLRID